MDTTVAATAVCLSDLPDDNIAEILTRVPDAVSLFRCTVVCKRWRGIICNPAFLRRRYGGLRRRPSLLGFFVQRHLVSTSVRSRVLRNTPSWAPVFVPAPGSALGPARRFLTSFVAGSDGMHDNATPLAARDGLLLLRLRPKLLSEKKTVLRLCVCDLLTGKLDLLSPIDIVDFGDDDGAIGYAVLRDAGRPRPADGYSTLFRVLIIGVHRHERRVYIGEVSSDAGARAEPVWIRGTLPIGNDAPHHGCRRIAAGVVSGGGAVVNWLIHAEDDDELAEGHVILHTLGVSISTGKPCLGTIALPMPSRFCGAWLCSNIDGNGDHVDDGNNKLSLLLACDDGKLSIWTQEDDDDEAEEEAGGGSVTWCRTRNVDVDMELGLGLSLSGMEPVCVAERSGAGAMLVLYRSDPDNAYLLDICSGSTEMVDGGKRSLNYATAVPCEINLLEFFMARLGVVQAAAADPTN